MKAPHLTISRDEVFKALAVVVTLSGAWAAVEARVSKIESAQTQQAQVNRDIRDDLREIRADVKETNQFVQRMAGAQREARRHPGP